MTLQTLTLMTGCLISQYISSEMIIKFMRPSKPCVDILRTTLDLNTCLIDQVSPGCNLMKCDSFKNVTDSWTPFYLICHLTSGN